MTTEEQATALGRLMQTYSDAKRRRAALISECFRLATIIDGAAATLRKQEKHDAVYPTDHKLPPDFPTIDRLMVMLKDVAEIHRAIDDSKRLITEAGIQLE